MSLDASLDVVRDAVLVFEKGELRFLNTVASELFGVKLERSASALANPRNCFPEDV